MRERVHPSLPIGLLATAAILATACASPARIAYDPAHDFARARSWQWLHYDRPNVRSAGGEAAGLSDSLKAQVERELSTRGLVRVETAPDFYVAYRLVVHRTNEYEADVGGIVTMAPFSKDTGLTVRSVERHLRVHETGDLLLGLIDARSGRVVWAGAVKERASRRFASRLDEAVTRILARYPPTPRDPHATPEGVDTRLAVRLLTPIGVSAFDRID